MGIAGVEQYPALFTWSEQARLQKVGVNFLGSLFQLSAMVDISYRSLKTQKNDNNGKQAGLSQATLEFTFFL